MSPASRGMTPAEIVSAVRLVEAEFELKLAETTYLEKLARHDGKYWAIKSARK